MAQCPNSIFRTKKRPLCGPSVHVHLGVPTVCHSERSVENPRKSVKIVGNRWKTMPSINHVPKKGNEDESMYSFVLHRVLYVTDNYIAVTLSRHHVVSMTISMSRARDSKSRRVSLSQRACQIDKILCGPRDYELKSFRLTQFSVQYFRDAQVFRAPYLKYRLYIKL